MQSWFYRIISIPVFGALYLFTALSVLSVLFLSWLRIRLPIRKILKFWAKSVFVIIGKRFRISGKENIDNNEKYILVANHGSLFDITAILSVYPEAAWFGHERLTKIPLFRNILKMTGYIPFRKKTVKNTRHMLEQLRQSSIDQSIAIFPEGTRTMDGKISDFYKGFIYLFRSTNMPILPITLNGFYLLKPKHRFYIDFSSDLEVIIHKPISREELSIKTNEEIMECVKKVIEAAYV
jgi:1-acyl-sn-glycerol-3-phosphate acyltransferase